MKKILFILAFLPMFSFGQNLNLSGGVFEHDTMVLSNGGWIEFSPTITWTGGTMTENIVAYYQVINNTVTFHISVYGGNSGTTVTGFNMTLPVVPDDLVNTWGVCSAIYDDDITPDGATIINVYINYDTTYNDQKLYCGDAISIPNAASYFVSIDGFYKIN